ncbi:MAG: light-harvesting protein [Gammaproteobacteria bacterium]
MAEGKSISGATPEEARAIHMFFWGATWLWFVTSCLAHYLIWNWVPWF